MSDFITLVKEVLEEKGMTPQDLFDADILSENTFYKYKNR